MKGWNSWGCGVGGVLVLVYGCVPKNTKKLSNRKRTLGNGNLRSLRDEVARAHTHTHKEHAQLA